MEDFDMPLFDIKITKDHFLVSGGGGQKDYGIDNGIMSITKEDSKRTFYKTEDIIKAFEVSEIDESNYLLVGIGTDNFYIIKFNGSFTLLKKIKKAVKDVIITENKDLYVLDNNKMLYGFSDILNNFETMKFKEPKKVNDSEYVYKLIKDKFISFEGSTASLSAVINEDEKENGKNAENDKFDAVKGVSKIFYCGDKIHVVRRNEGSSSFVVEFFKEEIKENVEKIIDRAGNLIFYTHNPNGSILYLNGEQTKMAKITDMSLHNEYLVVSTVYGEIYVFFKGKLSHKLSVSDMPITGVAIYGETVKFTMLTGVMGEMTLKKKGNLKILFILAFIILMIALLIKKYKNK